MLSGQVQDRLRRPAPAGFPVPHAQGCADCGGQAAAARQDDALQNEKPLRQRGCEPEGAHHALPGDRRRGLGVPEQPGGRFSLTYLCIPMYCLFVFFTNMLVLALRGGRLRRGAGKLLPRDGKELPESAPHLRAGEAEGVRRIRTADPGEGCRLSGSPLRNRFAIRAPGRVYPVAVSSTQAIAPHLPRGA